MTDVYRFIEGSMPLLVSVPHDGELLSDDSEHEWSDAAIDHPDRDWHVAKLYDFATELGASMIVANYSRYVIDLNRPPSNKPLYPGQLASGLLPNETFDGRSIYADEQGPSEEETGIRLKKYYGPYHARIVRELCEIRDKHGYALLWDAHSIRSRVLSLFDGKLPVLNIGTFDGASCDATLAGAVVSEAESSNYTTVINGRFKGGYITRAYGRPSKHLHAIQLELAQRAYMDEESRRFDDAKANELRKTLGEMLEAYLDAAARHYA